ncbi:Lrp/AsnC family transcriptional regulator, partial [Thermoproteota archaeon]
MGEEFTPHTASESLQREKPKLDAKDKKLLSAISFNARLSPSCLGKIVGISKDSVRYRLKKLRENFIIVKNITIVNHYALGF